MGSILHIGTFLFFGTGFDRYQAVGEEFSCVHVKPGGDRFQAHGCIDRNSPLADVGADPRVCPACLSLGSTGPNT